MCSPEKLADSFEKAVLDELSKHDVCHYAGALVSPGLFRAIWDAWKDKPGTSPPEGTTILSSLTYVTEHGPIDIVSWPVPGGEVHMADVDDNGQPEILKVLKLNP